MLCSSNIFSDNLHFPFLVFKVFDEDNDGNLNMKEWVFGLSKFLRGTFKEQIDCKYFKRDLFIHKYNLEIGSYIVFLAPVSLVSFEPLFFIKRLPRSFFFPLMLFLPRTFPNKLLPGFVMTYFILFLS